MSRLADWITDLVDRTVSAQSHYTASETTTDTFSTPNRLAVDNENGRVEIRGEDRTDVHLTGTIRARNERDLEGVSIQTTSGDDEPLTVRAAFDDPNDAIVELTLLVPRGLPISSVELTNGSIDVSNVGGDPTLRTTNGTIEATHIDGYLDVANVNGQVVATDVAGIDRAETVNGTLELEIPSIRTDAHVSGNNGAIAIEAGPELDAAVILETTVGTIDTPVFETTTTGFTGAVATGTLGTGDHELRVETTVGSLEFDRR